MPLIVPLVLLAFLAGCATNRFQTRSGRQVDVTMADQSAYDRHWSDIDFELEMSGGKWPPHLGSSAPIGQTDRGRMIRALDVGRFFKDQCDGGRSTALVVWLTHDAADKPSQATVAEYVRFLSATADRICSPSHPLRIYVFPSDDIGRN